MPDRSQSPQTLPTPKTLRNDACPLCERLLDELNVSFHDVHDFILRNYEDRTEDNDGYLGELGRLIHAQVVARRTLIQHQQKHS